MKWVVLVCGLLLGGCSTREPSAECARFVAGMRSAFQRYDANGDGSIDRQEYRDVINKLARTGGVGTPINSDDPAQTNQDFAALDKNKDGRVSFEEFIGNGMPQCRNGR